MERCNNIPIYYVDDFEDDGSDSDSIDSTTSGFTDHTMSTLSSNTAADYFKEINGRIFPIDDNVPRLVPADQIEVHRLDIQHTALRLLLNGNYYGPVKDVLADSAGRRKRVLDLLTAEGNWVREMAVEFPHVDFTSVDTIPLVPHVRQANILNFEVYDLYNGIAEPDESFDIVHLRHPISRIRDLQALIGEIHRVLRPGGLFLHSEFQNHPFDASTHDHSAAYTLPNLTRAMQIVESACIQQGAHVHAWKEVPFMLEPNHELWRENIKEHQRGFRSIRKDALILPTGPWHPTPRLHNVGVLIQWASTQMWSNLRPMFIGHGMSESETDELERGIREELAEPGSKKLLDAKGGSQRLQGSLKRVLDNLSNEMFNPRQLSNHFRIWYPSER